MTATQKTIAIIVVLASIVGLGSWANSTPEVEFVSNSDSAIQYTPFDGFDGIHQEAIENEALELPIALLPALEQVDIINGCHPWSSSEHGIGHCPFGTFDPEGWDADNTYGHDWANTVWISSAAHEAGKTGDVLIHEIGHAIDHHFFGDCSFPADFNISVIERLEQRFSGHSAPWDEVLADAFVLAYAESSDPHAWYLNEYGIDVSDNDIRLVRAAVTLCVTWS